MNGKIVPTTDETLYYKSNESTKKKRIHQIIFDLLAIAIIGVTFALVYYLLDPKISHFYCNDTDIFFPYIKDTIPFWALGIYGFLIPVFIILGVEIVSFIFINLICYFQLKIRFFYLSTTCDYTKHSMLS